MAKTLFKTDFGYAFTKTVKMPDNGKIRMTSQPFFKVRTGEYVQALVALHGLSAAVDIVSKIINPDSFWVEVKNLLNKRQKTALSEKRTNR